MICLTSHCGRPALVNISSITRDRPAGKKLEEQWFDKVSIVAKQRFIPHEYQEVHNDGGDSKGGEQLQPLVMGEAAEADQQDLAQGLESHRGAELRHANLK